MSGLADIWMPPHEQCGVMLCFFCCFITSEEVDTIGIVVSRKGIHFHFSVNYPFNDKAVRDMTKTSYPDSAQFISQ